MFQRFLGVLFVFFISFSAEADIRDSIRYYFKHKSPELIGGVTSRNTFIGSDKTSVTGINGGYEWGGKIRITAGIYWLTRPYEERRIMNAFTPKAYPVDESSRFWYLGFTGGYVFYRKNKWTLDIPVRVGIGSARVKQFNVSDGSLISKKVSAILPVETGVSALYKLTWWVGFSGGIGSRIVIGKNNSQKFSGTYYNLGATIFLGDIYHHIRKDMKNHPIKRK